MTNLLQFKSIFCLTFLSIAIIGCANDSGSSGSSSVESASQIGTPGSALFAPSDTEDREMRMKLLDLVNIERAKVGAGALVLEPLRNLAGQKFAIYLNQNIECDHSGENNNTPPDRMGAEGATFGTWGENVSCGASTPEIAMNWWMNSPGHKANILNGKFKQLGVGYYDGFWVQDFTD